MSVVKAAQLLFCEDLLLSIFSGSLSCQCHSACQAFVSLFAAICSFFPVLEEGMLQCLLVALLSSGRGGGSRRV